MLHHNIGYFSSDEENLIGMTWFRKHLKQGSRLALLALALQFGLSFGHFHGLVAQAAPSSVSGPTAAADAARVLLDAQVTPQESPAQHDDQQPVDSCAICAVMALAGMAMVSPPPALSLPQAFDFRYLATDAELLHLTFVGADFQARAPPAS
jgi:hypothetical protein